MMTRHDDDLVLIRLAVVMSDTLDECVYPLDVERSGFKLSTTDNEQDPNQLRSAHSTSTLSKLCASLNTHCISYLSINSILNSLNLIIKSILGSSKSSHPPTNFPPALYTAWTAGSFSRFRWTP